MSPWHYWMRDNLREEHKFWGREKRAFCFLCPSCFTNEKIRGWLAGQTGQNFDVQKCANFCQIGLTMGPLVKNKTYSQCKRKNFFFKFWNRNNFFSHVHDHDHDHLHHIFYIGSYFHEHRSSFPIDKNIYAYWNKCCFLSRNQDYVIKLCHFSILFLS